MTFRRFIASTLALAMLAVAGAAPAAAHHAPVDPATLPVRIDLPDGFQPEGIASRGHFLFSGSLVDGAIWRGDARTGTGAVLVPGTTGHAAAGMHVDRWGRLWVAGGPDHSIRVYDSRTGTLLREYAFPTSGFVNDLVVTRTAVYATDSINQQLLVVPLRWHGKLAPSTAVRTLPLIGQLMYTTGFNANGIVARGHTLILVQSNTGKLFRVDPRTGHTKAIDTGGYSLTNGDGLLLVGRVLYVVRNQSQLVAVLWLDANLRRARLIGEIKSTDPSVELSVPTTATTTLGALWVVNARFGVMPAPTEFWITRLPLWP